MITTTAVKACTKYGETKPLDAFYTNGGVSAKCKPCHLAHYNPAYIARWRERSLVASWGATCPVCEQPPETIVSAVPDGWLISHCALYWTVTDEQWMETFL